MPSHLEKSHRVNEPLDVTYHFMQIRTTTREAESTIPATAIKIHISRMSGTSKTLNRGFPKLKLSQIELIEQIEQI